MALCAQVINLIGLKIVKELYEMNRISQIAIMEEKLTPVDMRVLI